MLQLGNNAQWSYFRRVQMYNLQEKFRDSIFTRNLEVVRTTWWLILIMTKLTHNFGSCRQVVQFAKSQNLSCRLYKPNLHIGTSNKLNNSLGTKQLNSFIWKQLYPVQTSSACHTLFFNQINSLHKSRIPHHNQILPCGINV